MKMYKIKKKQQQKENNINTCLKILLKMFKISVETYDENCVHTTAVHKKDNKTVLWIKIHDIQVKLVVKNMSDLTIKVIKGIYNTKSLTKEQIRKYKRYGNNL